MKFTAANIERIATQNGLTTKNVVPSKFAEIEFLVVNLSSFKSAWFLMDNKTFNFKFSHTYNAATDKKTKSLPKIFKS